MTARTIKRNEWAFALAEELRKYPSILDRIARESDWESMVSFANELTEFASEIRHAAKGKQ